MKKMLLLVSISTAAFFLSSAAAASSGASRHYSTTCDADAHPLLSRRVTATAHPDDVSDLLDDEPFVLSQRDRDAREEEESLLDMRLCSPSLHRHGDANANADEETLLMGPRFGRPKYGSSWRGPLDEEIAAPLPLLSRSSSSASCGGNLPLPFLAPQRVSVPSSDDNGGWHRDLPPNRFRSTGTTVAGCLAANGTVVVLGADTRATDGTTVADRRCRKLHRLAANVWCAGAGTSADVDALTRRTEYTFRWRGKRDGEMIGNAGTTAGARETVAADADDGPLPPPPAAPVIAVLRYLRATLVRARGSLGVNLVLGGYDASTGRATLASIHPHGSVDATPVAALGSGGLAATGILELGYRGPERTSVEDAVDLVVRAIKAGIDNDLGSGSQVDIVVISSEGAEFRRGVVEEERLAPGLELEDMVSGVKTCESGNSEGRYNGDVVVEGAREEEKEERSAVYGVNGFGNVPFAIKSRRIVVRGKSDVARERREWLEKVLVN